MLRSSLTRLTLAALLAAALYGCGAVDARNQCNQARGWAEREVCESQVRSEFRDYEQRRQELVDGEAARKENQETRDRGMCFRRAATGELVCPN
jgi:hypothetical protein